MGADLSFNKGHTTFDGVIIKDWDSFLETTGISKRKILSWHIYKLYKVRKDFVALNIINLHLQGNIT